MAKKLKKKKTGLSPKAKFTLISAGKGIISNQSVIDGSKESPWWVAAIFFAVSVIIPLVPGFAKLSKASGSDFISSVNYGLDNTMASFAFEMNEQDIEFKVSGGTLHYYQNDTEKPEGFVTPDEEYIANATHEWAYTNSATLQYDLRVFFWKGLSTSKLSKYVNQVARQKFVRGTTQLPSLDPDVTESYYIPNIVIITPKTLAIALYKSNGTKQMATSLGGLDWTNFSKKVGLIEFLNKAAVKDGTLDTLDEIGYINQYHAQVLKQVKKVLNNTYLNQKKRSLWTNTGIYAAIYAGIILFLGLMIFILTRGKNNPFKFLNIWQCQKIAWWAAFTPAVLGMVLAFVFSGNAIGQLAFILLVSLRVMWLSMRQLRPVYQQQ